MTKSFTTFLAFTLMGRGVGQLAASYRFSGMEVLIGSSEISSVPSIAIKLPPKSLTTFLTFT
jgi:hypothetical protein